MSPEIVKFSRQGTIMKRRPKAPNEQRPKRIKQAERFIRTYWNRHGISPTTAEIARHLKIAPSAVVGYINDLEKMGVVRTTRMNGDGRRLARTIVLVDQEQEVRA